MGESMKAKKFAELQESVREAAAYQHKLIKKGAPMKKKTITPPEENYFNNYGNHFSNAVFYGWLNLDSIHRRLKRQLESVEEMIADMRSEKEEHENWNPDFPSEHLITRPCDCMWCTTKVRGTLSWKREKRKKL